MPKCFEPVIYTIESFCFYLQMVVPISGQLCRIFTEVLKMNYFKWEANEFEPQVTPPPIKIVHVT